jgi:hypothetical protein
VIAACAVFIALLAARAVNFWAYLLRNPSSFDIRSLRLIAEFGVWPLLLAAGMWITALGLGRRTLRLLGAPAKSPLDELSAAALGLGLLGQAVFLLGWAGELRPAALAALVLAAAALAAGELRRPTFPPRPAPRPLVGAAAGLLAFAALEVLLDALAPPIGWDVRAYHLAIPELGLRAGAWTRIPWMVHSHWPHLMEDLYALPLAAGRDGAAALLHAGAAALLVAGVFLAGRRAAGPAGGWLAALLLAGQPTFLAEAGTAHSDIAAGLFAFATAHVLARWDEEDGRGLPAAAGLLAGFAAASKMTLIGPLASWALWLAAVRRRPRAGAEFLGAGMLVFGPWLLKTWLETGSPLWPFLTRFGGTSADQALAARTLLVSRWGFPPPAWIMTEDAPVFLLAPLGGLWLLSGSRRAKMGPEERWLWISAPLLFLLTIPQRAAWRYMIPLWPALTLAAARMAAPLFDKRDLRAAAAAALAAFGVYPIAAASPNNELFAVLALRPSAAPDAGRREYWADRTLFGLTGFYRDARAVLPSNARVLLWREIRGYGAGFDYQWGDPVNQDLVEYRSIADPDALCARLKALGVTYVLEHPSSHIYQPDPGYYDARTLSLMSHCLERSGRVVLERDGFSLHELL